MIGATATGVNDGNPGPPDVAAQLWAAWRRAYPTVERHNRALTQLPGALKELAGWPFGPDDARADALADALAALFAKTVRRGECESRDVLEHLTRAEDKRGDWMRKLEPAFRRRAIERYRRAAAVAGTLGYGSGEDIVAGLVRPRQPFVIGGAEKTGKTCLAIDLAAAVTTGTSFLGRAVGEGEETGEGEPRGVWALTLETPPALWVERFERAVKARGCDVGAARARLTVTSDLRTLRKNSERAELSAFIENSGTEVAIIDPLYQALPPVSSADLGAQGDALRKLVRPIVRAGAAPVLVAHFTKSAAVGAVPSLHDLAGSAVGPFARSWLLVSRREAYAGDLRHQLAARIGSSAGDYSTDAIEFDEWRWALDSAPLDAMPGKGRRKASPFAPKKGA